MEQYLIYLRKSRKDRDMEEQTGQFDTLDRHRRRLLALAEEKGLTITGIFEEVVSGDTIAERPEMQKLLSAVETGEYAGVLVMEVPRLARGNTRDQGTVSETFQYSGTKIITPDKVYDPSDEADEEYFEFGLFMSRREYKAINKRLQRGRMASLEEGKYIGGAAPYGYRKVKIAHAKGYTLEIIPETADVVREIFQLYTKGEPQADGTLAPIGSYGIANLLNSRGIPSPGGIKWAACSVRDIIKNPTYAGFVRWAYRPQTKRMVDGKIETTFPVNANAIVKKGVHAAIIAPELWNKADEIIKCRSHAPVPSSKQISNPLAGIVYCSVCGRSMLQIPHGSKSGPMLMCPTAKCATVGSRLDVVESGILDSLGNWLKSYRVQAGSKMEEDKPDDTEKALKAARRDLQQLHAQKNKLYDLLESGVYTQEIFLTRSRVLAGRISDAEKAIANLEDHVKQKSLAENTRKQMIPRVQNVLKVYSTLNDPAEQNALLRSVLDRVVYAKSVGGRYVQSDLQLFIFPKISPF